MTLVDPDTGAQFADRATTAEGDRGLATGAAMFNQGMSALGPAGWGEQRAQLTFDRHRVAMPGPAEPSAQALHMGIDHHPGNSEYISQHDIRGFPSHPGEGDQLRKISRHRA